PDIAAGLEFVEVCLRALPEILSGRVRATDIIFPGASMHRVEAIYAENAVAGHFNRCVADASSEVVRERLQADPHARLRILEVGAGTGSTTAAVLPRL